MDNLIDSGYFWGKLKRSYLNISPYNNTPSAKIAASEQDELTKYISIYQKEYLTQLFGSNVVPDDEEIKALLFDSTLQISPIANYVFCKLLLSSQSKSTASGVTVKATENSTLVSYQDLYSQAWNEMVKFNITIRSKIDELGLTDTYPVDIYIENTEFIKDFFKAQYFIC